MLARALLGARRSSGLVYVGGNGGNWAGAVSGNNTVSLTALTGGSSSSARPGDTVIAVYGTGSGAVDRTLSITDGTTNYTLIGSELYRAAGSYSINLRVAYKVLTTADTSVTFGPTQAATDAGAAVVHVWRGVDRLNPLDVAVTTANGINPAQPNPAAITPATSGAKIVIVGGACSSTLTVMSGSYMSGSVQNVQADTYDAAAGIGYVDWTSGAYDPAAWTGGNATSGSWAAMTLALRPE